MRVGAYSVRSDRMNGDANDADAQNIEKKTPPRKAEAFSFGFFGKGYVFSLSLAFLGCNRIRLV